MERTLSNSWSWGVVLALSAAVLTMWPSGADALGFFDPQALPLCSTPLAMVTRSAGAPLV